ncbi:NRDE protein-domain-containing protein [Calycina marina]|uniref:NRDE protein-domain-containing protein n=1 Tax=Calycina marina TaxID=1763456 RepID=A0A9P7Z3H4_9HELO|nr:NRDE protein-domain-containing protein [Calycina marina]
MCIVLATTAHPDYALIVLDNRDEFILRPTSRPHWWSSTHQDILSSRDLQRVEQGTWLGITKTGNFAVLTNYRETDTQDEEHPVQGEKSRGGMVTAWLTALNEETTESFVERMVNGGGVKGVGGFSLLCGKLRPRKDLNDLEPLAIISNRAGDASQVPCIAGKRGEYYGLSNTCYDDPKVWPKVERGKELLQTHIQTKADNESQEDLITSMFQILDNDTLPPQEGQNFEAYIYHLRESIFIPAIGQAVPPQAIPLADEIAAAHADSDCSMKIARAPLMDGERPDPLLMTGVYGTQRQTILLVTWDGHVKYIERSLWDGNGNAIMRGAGDVTFEFDIDGWNGHEVRGMGGA